jgi:hypothetical protein
MSTSIDGAKPEMSDPAEKSRMPSMKNGRRP